MRISLLLVGSMLLALVARPVAAQVNCDAARCAVQTMVNQNCTCSTGTSVTGNHGNYVSCVAKQVNMLSKSDPALLPTNCKGKVTRCAAKSICGKAGFVTCQIPLVFGTCDTSTGSCTTGTLATGLTTCSSDQDCRLASGTCDTMTGTCSAGSTSTAPCTMDSNCVIQTKCKIKSSSDLCTAAGGSAGTSPTCCPNCAM